MADSQFDLTQIKQVDQIEDSAKVNRLLDQGWVILKVTETQWRDEEGAIRATIVYTIGTTLDLKR
ncbi:hypothetical protein OW944_23500 [Klebsiella pneumoniae]|jgi:hypothetical protein|uniref:hypothetical protein n=1 Tax=Enterobacterales TaxID=91347 RepID=UPI000E5C903A|nr:MULTISPECIES: hypothetical protein [Enterobacterales]MDN2606949.1 hypothetical protein [Klebsiella variicola]MDU4748299.1 hypothetical protein [Pantoea sp.]AXZ12063.1 hypothetical protein AM455_04550 [Klebsiella pneumoniae]MCQ5472521.1 hypothetical protein [Pantoea brenneri]MCY0500307.1 hypothetical protein [Klebsiella pneumoniae]